MSAACDKDASITQAMLYKVDVEVHEHLEGERKVLSVEDVIHEQQRDEAIAGVMDYVRKRKYPTNKARRNIPRDTKRLLRHIQKLHIHEGMLYRKNTEGINWSSHRRCTR